MKQTTQPIKAIKHQTNYWEVVHVDKENNEIIMLDYVFSHGDGFKGATGTKFEPIPKAEYDERMEDENIIESMIDNGMELPANYKRTGFEGLVNDMDYNDKESFQFDASYREHWHKLRELGYPESEYPIFNCTGGGRCFDSKFNGNTNPHLSKIIRQYESK